jgi:hypothetical protein
VVWAAAAYFAFSKAVQAPSSPATSTAVSEPPTAIVGATAAPSLPAASAQVAGAQVASAQVASAQVAGAQVASAQVAGAQVASAQVASAATGDSPAPAVTQSAATAPAADATDCVRALFPRGSFDYRKPTFAFVCEQADPLKGGTEVRSQLVLGGGQNVTDGMRLWAGLGWYEMAAYSVLRAHCCANPPELRWNFKLVCTVDQSLAKLEAAVAKKDKAAVAEAAEGYLGDARCLSQFGQGRNFGQAAPPGAGRASFEKLLGAAGVSPRP